jgi:hypothetical protein
LILGCVGGRDALGAEILQKLSSIALRNGHPTDFPASATKPSPNRSRPSATAYFIISSTLLNITSSPSHTTSPSSSTSKSTIVLNSPIEALAAMDYPMDDSPLSSMAPSEDEYPDEATEIMDEGPPPKRIKVTGAGRSNTPSAVAPDPEVDRDDSLAGMSDVSSDTDGDVPSSPIHSRPDEDDFQEQITVCAWEGCRIGDLGNMDKLVEHIHNDHIETRQKKYTCEWVGCPRKSMPHASGYALKAHMRSHTREKPFYCYLPGKRLDFIAQHHHMDPFGAQLLTNLTRM